MSNIMFFCIPAHGHTNPTIEVVRTLVSRGHRIKYYSFPEFKEKIEGTGAEYVDCQSYLPPAPDDLDKKAGRDFASLIEMAADTTVNLDETVSRDIEQFRPDCIVSDSVCFWGKLLALKFNIPFVCSTTTFAFNKYTAKLMKQSFAEIISMFTGMPRINAKMELLKSRGYKADSFVSIIQNDNDTNTIVYTSKKFQPMSDTFSDRYAFIGPSIDMTEYERKNKSRPLIYISMGTVLNNCTSFFKNCINAFGDGKYDIIISAGKDTDISSLGKIPENINVYPRVNQLETLSQSDLFITHCGMNSVSESLFKGVPMILFPQHSEQGAVAARAEELGAGIRIKKGSSSVIRRTAEKILSDESYAKAAKTIGEDFRCCKGPGGGADFIEKIIAGK